MDAQRIEFDTEHWDLTCWNRQPVAVLSVKISLSLDGGRTWLQGLLACDGTTDFPLPDGGTLMMKIGHDLADEADSPVVTKAPASGAKS